MTELKDLNVPKEDKEWLKVIYTEAWNQYAHEDNLGQSRFNFFLGIQTAFVALLAALFTALLGFESMDLKIAFISLAGIAALFGIFSCLFGAYWKEVTKAGQQYLNLRWIPIAVIEKLAQIEQIGIAGVEAEWRTFSKQNPGVDYYPFKDYKELENIYLSSRQKVGGWDLMIKVIRWFQFIYFILALIFVVIGVAIHFS